MSEEIKKSAYAENEEKVLAFWKQNNIFQKSMDERANSGKEFVFYEGPPTANGNPGIHHLEARAFKDVIPRYKTMRGYHVRRKGGWDTHGLPVELQVEKKLGLNSKKMIEEYGVAKFNKECKENVWMYLDQWNKFTERIGYWVDQKNPYVTYHNDYIESLWNVVKKVDEQNLLYKDYKVVPWCPRCGTALSSHELAQGYEDVKDLSLYVKFKVKNPEKINLQNQNVYLLAWTTTPWTLPGNVALAVGNDIDYVKVKYLFSSKFEAKIVDSDKKLSDVPKAQNTFYILAKVLLPKIFDDTPGLEIVEEFKGSQLVELGLEYEPLFPELRDFMQSSELKKEEFSNWVNGWKVYAADFVTTEDGTGIVHTAVMYGQDDFELGSKPNVNLPKLHTVDLNGNFISGVSPEFLQGRFVKEKNEEGKPTLDVDIIKYLQENNLYFNKELYEHSYPHCWRCKTALIYYARDSWYVRMTDPRIKEKLIEENKTINWEPSHIREGRFGEWIDGVKDWAISRERYWGTPLPVWLANDGEKIVVDSLDTLKKYTKKSGNKYFVMRHGGTEGNESGLVSFSGQAEDNLTDKGREEVSKTAEKLSDKKIDFIITSPFTRTRETTEILRDKLGLNKDQVIEDARLGEINPGEFDGKSWKEYHDYVSSVGSDWFTHKIAGGESFADVLKRVGEALYEIEEKYKDKNILFVTHGGTAWLFFVASGMHTPNSHDYVPDQDTEVFIKGFERFKNAELRGLDFAPVPHNEGYELDFHRPYIDEVVLVRDGKEFYRTKEVMDVWFDSGAMPFAQDHYPFDFAQGKPSFGKDLLYPADFISEAIDQTRGWFYTLHAVGVLMGRGKAYRNVICLGHLLDAKGKKMSKSLGNIVDPWSMIEKYGVDTLRLWMYSVNQPGESKNFDEKTVMDLNRQVFGLYYNVLAFYELYREKDLENDLEVGRQDSQRSDLGDANVLDQWILAKLAELTELTTKNLDEYKVLEPVRAMREFMSDLSTWYLRRSRDRIKDGDKNAKATLYFVLKNIAKLLAPFAPFAAEDVWQKLKNESDAESVHLVDWPVLGKYNQQILEDMKLVREDVSMGLKERQMKGFPVRQPLSSLATGAAYSSSYDSIVKDELNVVEIRHEGKPGFMQFNFEITPELKAQGDYRELVRAVQDIRKQMNLIPSDLVKITIESNAEGQGLVEKFKADFSKTVGAKDVLFAANDGVEIKIEDMLFKVKIEK